MDLTRTKFIIKLRAGASLFHLFKKDQYQHVHQLEKLLTNIEMHQRRHEVFQSYRVGIEKAAQDAIALPTITPNTGEQGLLALSTLSRRRHSCTHIIYLRLQEWVLDVPCGREEGEDKDQQLVLPRQLELVRRGSLGAMLISMT